MAAKEKKPSKRAQVIRDSLGTQWRPSGQDCRICRIPAALKEIDLIIETLKTENLSRGYSMIAVSRAYRRMMPDGPRIGAGAVRGHLRNCRPGWNE